MDNFRWRSKVRYVAYIDLVIYSFNMVLLIFGAMMIAAVYFSPKVKNENTDMGFPIFLTVCFSFGYICAHFWSSNLLLRATKPGTDLKLALRNTIISRRLNVGFLVINLITIGFILGLALVLGLRLIPIPIEVFLRACTLFFVNEFIDELQKAIKDSSSEFDL